MIREICFVGQKHPVMFLCKRLKCDVATVFMWHYQEYSLKQWQELLDACCAHTTHCCYVIEDHTIKAIALYTKNDSIKLEILCSRAHRGGMLLDHIVKRYRDKRVHLYAEPRAIGFYLKYGFVIVDDVGFRDEWGIRYPLMTNKLAPHEHELSGTWWPGIAFYFWVAIPKWVLSLFFKT